VFLVGLMCKTLEVSRSGFYAWLDRPECDRARENRRLTALIQGIFTESRGIYGVPRVHETLRQLEDEAPVPREDHRLEAWSPDRA